MSQVKVAWSLNRRTQPGVERDAKPSSGGCRHYWVIDSPDGPQSKGVCKLCGEARLFSNSWQYSSWEHGELDTPEPDGWKELTDAEPPIHGVTSIANVS